MVPTLFYSTEINLSTSEVCPLINSGVKPRGVLSDLFCELIALYIGNIILFKYADTIYTCRKVKMPLTAFWHARSALSRPPSLPFFGRLVQTIKHRLKQSGGKP
jgi:hypothetical protein